MEHTSNTQSGNDTKISTSRWSEHRFLLMIAASIGVTIILVSIGSAMYYVTGTAQLDLSRPSYRAVRDEVKKNTSPEAQTQFSANGSVDEAMFKDFKKRYTSSASDVTGVDAFSGEPMSDQALGIKSSQ